MSSSRSDQRNSLRIIEEESSSAEIILLDSQFFAWPWSSEQWKDVDWNNYRLFSLLEDERTIGFIFFQLLKGDNIGHLLKIIIVPHARRRGLSRFLFDDALQKMKDLGLEEVYLEVEADNSVAICLYESMGFYKHRVIKDFYGKSRHAIAMGLTVA